jgi:hypothetical protein
MPVCVCVCVCMYVFRYKEGNEKTGGGAAWVTRRTVDAHSHSHTHTPPLTRTHYLDTHTQKKMRRCVCVCLNNNIEGGTHKAAFLCMFLTRSILLCRCVCVCVCNNKRRGGRRPGMFSLCVCVTSSLVDCPGRGGFKGTPPDTHTELDRKDVKLKFACASLCSCSSSHSFRVMCACVSL